MDSLTNDLMSGGRVRHVRAGGNNLYPITIPQSRNGELRGILRLSPPWKLLKFQGRSRHNSSTDEARSHGLVTCISCSLTVVTQSRVTVHGYPVISIRDFDNPKCWRQQQAAVNRGIAITDDHALPTRVYKKTLEKEEWAEMGRGLVASQVTRDDADDA